MSPQERAAYRAFVREHHPDRGGDPEIFKAGLARFAVGPDHAAPDPDDGSGRDVADDDPRLNAPIEIVRPLPFPVRVAVALMRTARRRRRVE